MEWLDSYYSRDYLKQIDTLKEELKGSKDLVTGLETEREVLKVELELVKQQIISVKKELELYVQSQLEVQEPDWLINHMKYKPIRRFVSKTMDVTLPFAKPQHCFDKSTVLYDLMKEKGLYKVEKTYVNMEKVMKLITGLIDYESDKTDDWRSISDVLIFKRGDCEDIGGIAITSALGMAGWKEDEVFLSVGWYYPKGKSVEPDNKYCHAWCKAKCDGKWYVLEGTSKTAVPRLWVDWKDKYEETFGCCNWKFEGMIKNNQTYL